jgi:peptide chain release factor 2
VMRQLSDHRETVETWIELENKVNNLIEMADLLAEEQDEQFEIEVKNEIASLSSVLDNLEIKLILNDDYDDRDAILAIHAGAGGTESQDWAEMLLRMYVRWAEKNKCKVEILDTTPGDEAGIKSTTLEIRGRFAFGNLKSEKGVHRLVRLSPFDADHARHTSFALVEILPEVRELTEININSEDLKIDTFRSSGPGGQHMQKTSSAVRITHIPTGLIVSCQNQRSQLQNKEAAMRILEARLLELELDKKEQERVKLKGQHIEAGWGNQIRSYVLHPYKMVKDHRTEYEVSDPSAVLDGDIDDFIKAYLRSKVGE